MRRRNKPKKTSVEIEDEILELYTVLADDSTDLYLRSLPELFARLQIPSCFTQDITKCIDYYYEFMHGKGVEFDSTNVRHYTTLNLIHKYTVGSTAASVDDIVDIVDIDKLIANATKLVVFRNNYEHILASWALFVTTANSKVTEDQLPGYMLSLPDLKVIKEALNVELKDSVLIDMIGASMVDGEGRTVSFDYTRGRVGSAVGIKEFAGVLEEIGEL